MKKVVVMSKPKEKKPEGKEKKKKTRFELAKESLAFKVLTTAQTKEVQKCTTVREVESKLVECMSLSNHEDDLLAASMLDYYTGAVWWSKEQAFNDEQLSAFFTVSHRLLDNIKSQQTLLVDNLRELKKMFVGIGQESTETNGGLVCFTTQQAKLISDYMKVSLFQHYRMYEYLFHHPQAEEIIGTDLDVEVAPPASLPWPSPLDEGVAEDLYNTYIATPPPATAQTEKSDLKSEKSDMGGGKESSKGESRPATAAQIEADILAFLTPEEVKDTIQQVFTDTVQGLQSDIAQKLREKENAFIQRINKIHIVAES